MQVLHLSTNDLAGGASIAAFRLHQSLVCAEIQSNMLVQRKIGHDESVIGPTSVATGIALRMRPVLDRMFTRISSGGTQEIFFPSSVPWSNVVRRINKLSPDLVNLHWVCGGMFRIEDLQKFGRPIVWTLHDMWAFTGGCHYAGECSRYATTCHSCPKLRRNGLKDLSSRVFKRKVHAYRNLGLTIVTPSQWLADCASESTLFAERQIEVIPYGLNLETFRPIERSSALSSWNLPGDQPLILFGALKATSDQRKGFDLLQQAAICLRQQGIQNALFLVFGASKAPNPPDFDFPVRYLGNLQSDAKLARLYSVADVMVVPSREDNLPLTALESLACGTPVVSFRTGGLVDIVDHQITGYLATPFDPKNLAQGIAWVLADRDRLTVLSQQARQKALDCYSLETSASRYIALYEEILDR